MGIFCQINLSKPSDDIYTPGTALSGVVKYVLDEEMSFNRIIVSLKGKVKLNITITGRYNTNFYNNEEYVDMVDVVHDKEQKFAAGSHEIPFSFILPPDIPSSLEYSKFGWISVYCMIKYCVRVKFERPGFMKFDKKYQKAITVVSSAKPNLLSEPTIFGEQKKITQLFSKRTGIVTIKAVVQSCLVKSGDKIKIHYELANDTNATINIEEAKIAEVYTFISEEKFEVEKRKIVLETDITAEPVRSGDTQSMDIEIQLPPHLKSLNHSKMVSRDFVVLLKVKLPHPHSDMVLSIPVQICGANTDVTPSYNEDPPSYWEAMNKEKKTDFKFFDE